MYRTKELLILTFNYLILLIFINYSLLQFYDHSLLEKLIFQLGSTIPLKVLKKEIYFCRSVCVFFIKISSKQPIHIQPFSRLFRIFGQPIHSPAHILHLTLSRLLFMYDVTPTRFRIESVIDVLKSQSFHFRLIPPRVNP